jgi:hypothetical protein
MTGKCPHCGTPTRPFEAMVLKQSITFQVACDKLRGTDLRELMSENRGPTIIRRLAEFSTVYFVTPLHERANPIVQLERSAHSA